MRPRSQVDDRRRGRELADVGVRVAGHERRHRAVAPVGRDARAAGDAGEPDGAGLVQRRVEDARLEAGRPRRGQAEPAAGGEIDALALLAREQALPGPAAAQRREREAAVARCRRSRSRLRNSTNGCLSASRRAIVGRATAAACSDARGPPRAWRAAAPAKPATPTTQARRAGRTRARGGSRPGAPQSEARRRASRPRGRRRRPPARSGAEPRPQRAEERPRRAAARRSTPCRAARARCPAAPRRQWPLPSAISTPSVAA